MDQLISAFGKKAHALLIDCRTIGTKAVSMPRGVAVIIINSNLKRTLVGSEPTADYHRNIAWCLHEQGAQCHLNSSARCARAREMLFKSWDKNVRKDAIVIMYLLEQGLSLPFFDCQLNQWWES